MKQQKVITPNEYLNHSYKYVQILFYGSIVFVILSIVFLIYYFASRQKYKDITQNVHYVNTKPMWLYISLSMATLSLIFISTVWFRYYKIFKFEKSGTEWFIVSIFLISCALIATNVAFIIYKEPCTDPDKYVDKYGNCSCLPGLQSFSDGTCGCGLGYVRIGNSCLEGCASDKDCPSGLCNTSIGACCPNGYILCKNDKGSVVCCQKDFCRDDGSGGAICCADEIRRCTDPSGNSYCCPTGTVCPSGSTQCVAQCGPSGNVFCKPNEDCFVMDGQKDSLQVFADGLQNPYEIDCQSGTNNCSLYYCTSTENCPFDSTPQFIPGSTGGNQSSKVFYPCYNVQNLPDASGKTGIDQIDICVPTDVDGDYNACISNDGCSSDACETINIAKANYFDNSKDNLTRVNKGLQALVTTQGNYKGDYCGEGKIKVIANKISGSSCSDDIQAANSCATKGVFQNSKYTYFGKSGDDYYCNTYIDCDNFDSSNKEAYFTSYQIGDGPSSPYQVYNNDFVPSNSVENTKNETQMQNERKKIQHLEKEILKIEKEVLKLENEVEFYTDTTSLNSRYSRNDYMKVMDVGNEDVIYTVEGFREQTKHDKKRMKKHKLKEKILKLRKEIKLTERKIQNLQNMQASNASCDIDTSDTSYTWSNTCPTTLEEPPADVWSGSLPGSAGQTGMCPKNLEFIQSCSTKDDVYQSNFCNTVGEIIYYDSTTIKDPLPIGIIIANSNPTLDLSNTDWYELNGQTLSGGDFQTLLNLTGNIGWIDDTGLNVVLPDLRGRTIFSLSPVDDKKNIDPVFQKEVGLNQQFGILAPKTHNHASNPDACPGTYGCIGQQNVNMNQSGTASQPLADMAKEFITSETGYTSDAQNVYPPYLGVRWLVKATSKRNSQIPIGTILFSEKQFTDPRIQDFGDDEFFMFHACENYAKLFKGCSDQPTATIKLNERGGGKDDGVLCHSHKYLYADTSSKLTLSCCTSVQPVVGRADIAFGGNTKALTSDNLPPYQKYYGYKTIELINDNWLPNIIFFYPNRTIPPGFTGLDKIIHTPFISKRDQGVFDNNGGQLNVISHAHRGKRASASTPGQQGKSGGDRVRVTNHDAYVYTEDTGSSDLDAYPPAAAYYGIVYFAD